MQIIFKYILLFGLLGVIPYSTLQAQNKSPQIQVNLDDFDLEEFSKSERILINILVKKEVKKLEQKIEQLHTDKEFGRITEAEYQKQKHLASTDITSKIGRSIDILTNKGYFPDNGYNTTDSNNLVIKSELDSAWYSYVNFRTNLYRNKKMDIKDRSQVSFGLRRKRKGLPQDTIGDNSKATTISGNIGFGYTNWMDQNNERFDDPDKKLSGNSSLYYEIGLKANYYLDEHRVKTSIDYGITLISRYYHFNDKGYAINHPRNGVTSIVGVQITKSVFSQTALEFPLSITHRFTNSCKERLTISAGIYGGINIRSRQKIKYSINNRDYKAKWISDFNTNRFYTGARVSIGYNSIYLIARYNFTPLFKSSSDIEVFPYTIGLSFGL